MKVQVTIPNIASKSQKQPINGISTPAVKFQPKNNNYL